MAVIGTSEGAAVAADLAFSGVGSLDAAVALSPVGAQPRGAVPAPPVPPWRRSPTEIRTFRQRGPET